MKKFKSSNLKKFLSTILAIVTIFVGAAMPTSASAYSKQTYYTNYGCTWGTMSYATRTKVTSTVVSTNTSYTSKQKVGSVKNTSKYTAKKTFTISKTSSRSYSFSASADVPVKLLKNDVKLTIGGSLTFSETLTLSAMVDVPAKTTSPVYLRYEKESIKYKYVCQKQQQDIYGKWRNVGKSYTKYATVTTSVPEIIV